jgi:heme-degrading monooxygenase HmoA
VSSQLAAAALPRFVVHAAKRFALRPYGLGYIRSNGNQRRTDLPHGEGCTLTRRVPVPSGLHDRCEPSEVDAKAKLMIGLFFEVMPLDDHKTRYFELAAFLRPELEKSGGVLFVDRYTSVERPDVVLSHQWWEDEDALVRWRQNAQHRAIQRAGREQHFRDYRLRIGPAIDPERAVSVARTLWISYYDAEPAGPFTGELFRSVYREGKCLVLSEHASRVRDEAADRKVFEITRDYTMYERAEAPQDYPAVPRR